MTKRNDLQDSVLAKLREERRLVTVFITNGYQLKGRITAFDQYVIAVENQGVQQLVYKHAVSTIRPDRPVDLDGLGEEG